MGGMSVVLGKSEDEPVVCPGCGWYGPRWILGDYGSCPVCKYEDGDASEGRLLTLTEMAESQLVFDDVRMDKFLATVFSIIGVRAT